MKVPYATTYGGRVNTRRRVSFLCRLNLGVVPNSSSAEKFRLKFDILSEINATKFVKTRTRLNIDGFASVAVVDAV